MAALAFESPISTAKYKALVVQLDAAIAAAKKHKVKTAFGTDMLFDAELAAKQGKFPAKLKEWCTVEYRPELTQFGGE